MAFETFDFDVCHSPLGDIVIKTDNHTLRRLYFIDTKNQICVNEIIQMNPKETRFSRQVKEWLSSYFNGHNPNPKDIPIFLDKETLFHRSQIIQKFITGIPYGTVITYSDAAKQFNKVHPELSPTSARGVGSAMRNNTLLIFCPCHRVLNKNGTIGGFAAGVERKKRLLEIENYNGYKETKEKTSKKKKSH